MSLCARILLAIAVVSSATTGLQAQEFRGFWADVFHEGFKSPAEVDALVSRAVAGRYNAILPEVMAYQDNALASHGAYWRSSIIPRSSVVTSSFDPLGYLVQQAHAAGLQVHPWLVAFRVSTAWPPAGNTLIAAHPEYLMVPQASMGSVASVGGDYQLDPGSPEVQDYLVSIAREIASNYEVDGIHWDYIRYTQADAGYPTNTSYANSSLARFRRITGYTGTPPATGNASWDSFRRRTITEVVRRVRAELASVNSVRQPLRHSAALVTWGSAPSSFSGSSAWARFQNWEEWMRLGFLDTGIPMTYYDYSTYPSYYTSWVDKEMVWRYQRQMVVGPAVYLNTFTDSLTELQYARSKGADGVCTYSYWATKKSSANDWTWYNYVAANFFTAPADVPVMPWRDPATASEGTLWGQVIDPSTGSPIDDATVAVGTTSSAQTDANGYYVITMLPATAGGTTYSVTMSKTGLTSMTHNVVITAGSMTRDDFTSYGPPPPTIAQQPVDQTVCPAGAATFTVAASGEGSLAYQWQKDGANLLDGGHYAGATTPTLAVSPADATDVGTYRCVVTGSGGSTTSNGATLAINSGVSIAQQPASQTACSGAAASFTVAAAGAASYQWAKDGIALTEGGHYAGVNNATLVVTGADATDVGGYTCAVTGDCGSAATSDVATLTVGSAPAITLDPVSQTIDSAATAQFSVAATGDGVLSYRWQKNGTDLADGGHYSGTSTAILVIASADANDAAAYRCVVTADCGSVTSAEATLAVNPAPAALAVTPDSGLTSSGMLGGPFSPSSITYTLTNTGGFPIDWTAAVTQTWVSLDKAGGTLSPGASDTVVVSINAQAASLAAGTYNDSVAITNLTNGIGSTTRPVSLTVTSNPGAMAVTPPDGLSSSGRRGGPFTPSSITYTVTNTGGEPINWTVADNVSWLSVSKTGGTLAPGASDSVVVSINSGANTLRVGTYTGVATFTNTTNGTGNTTRTVTLRVRNK